MEIILHIASHNVAHPCILPVMTHPSEGSDNCKHIENSQSCGSTGTEGIGHNVGG